MKVTFKSGKCSEGGASKEVTREITMQQRGDSVMLYLQDPSDSVPWVLLEITPDGIKLAPCIGHDTDTDLPLDNGRFKLVDG